MTKRMHPVRRLRKLLAETQQLRRDLEWWNNNRLDAEPFDLGREVVLEKLITAAIGAWATEDFPTRHQDLIEYMNGYAKEM